MGKHILLYLIAATMLNCWPFEPRKAEQPSSFREPESALSPSRIPELLTEIYNNRLPELHTSRIIAPDFIFYSDPSENTGARSWGKETELRVSNAIMKRYSSISLKFGIIGEDPVNPKGLIIRSYTLSGVTESGSMETFAGKAEFLAEEQAGTGEWLLKQWKDYDIRTDTLLSWGQLKLKYK